MGTGVNGFNGWGGFATSIELSSPRGVTTDSIGNMYFSDSGNFRLCKVTAEGILTTIAGKGISGFSGDGGPAVDAKLMSPGGTAIDTLGNLYFTESVINRIRKISVSGIITTIAGNGLTGFVGDGGPATSATLSAPQSVAVDAAGNLYIADSGNNRIRKVNAAGIISTVAGNGMVGWSGDGGPATEAQLSNPQGVAVDAEGNIYIADYSNNRIRKVNSEGIISTIAGNGSVGFDGDDGPAIEASLETPQSVWADEAGNVFISDVGNDRVRKIDANGIISTIAGTGNLGYNDDGVPATEADLYYPLDVTVDPEGNLFFADVGNHRIRKVEGPGSVTTYFPQVALGGGYSTNFTITNTGATEVSAELKLTGSDGLPLVASGVVSNPGTEPETIIDSTFSVLIPPGGVTFISADSPYPENPTQIGWARLISDEGSLTAVATYEYSVGEKILTMVGVIQSQRIPSATIPVDNIAAQTKQLAYALANPSGQTITVELVLVSQSGTVVDDTISIQLGPREHTTRYLWQDIENEDFKGSVVFRGKNGVPFVLLGVLEKQGIYTALPITTGAAPGLLN